MNRRKSMRNTRHKIYTNDPQKKYRLGTVSNNIILEDLNRFHGTNLSISSDVDQDQHICLVCMKDPYSQRTSNTLNQVAEAKSLKVWSYVEKYAEYKKQNLKKIGWYTKMLCATEYPGGRQFLKLVLKWGTLYHIY